MEKIRLKFSVTPSLFPGNGMVVVMTLDEKGKSYKVKKEDFMEKMNKVITRLGVPADEHPKNKKEMPPLPKRVLNAFTENTINKILSKDEIPNESGMMILDGNNYQIKISKGEVCKEYDADDASIETYPLLRYLASWCRRQ